MDGLSVIIPASNEETRIGPCLDALLAQQGRLLAQPGTAEPGTAAPETGAGMPVQVVVVPNGCRDGTEAAARRREAGFAARGWPLTVTGSPPGKIRALNAGDEAARWGARLYLDADILCGPGLLAGLVEALDRPGPVYAGARLRVAPPRSAVSRRYARFWQRLPFLTRGVSGAGLFAVNAAGRARWGLFPDVIADDAYVRALFSPAERVLVDVPYSWPISEGFGALVRVRGRQDDGVRELAARFPELMANVADRPDRDELRGLALRDPAGFATYAAVSLATRLRRRRGGWERSR